ncbi:hypothetical protein B0T25DRAFT_250614 [Lasiosphaeria hispida]|uniref:Secreted protein n=1 Tax=Lasiosphaeria hispida TaxID=260671 RepID=A0AAJ0MD36_9PEZI|nr:hypothetical protein B0T25DRAFT_250614 [Lasiosphaeria hispida]
MSHIQHHQPKHNRVMFLRNVGLLLLGQVAVASSLSVTSPPRVLPRASNINITSVATQGNGCPLGSISTSISPDGTTLTFGFDEFKAYYGPGYTPADKSKQCTIAMAVSYRSGQPFELLGATYRGPAQLGSGVTGTIYSSYVLTPASDAVASTQVNSTGPFMGVYTKSDTIAKSSRMLAPCQGTQVQLQINTRVSVTSRNASFSGGFDDEAPFSLGIHQLHLGWSQCGG